MDFKKYFSRQFGIAIIAMFMGFALILLGALDVFEYLQSSVPIFFGGLMTIAGGYIGVSGIRKIKNGKDK